MRSRAPALLVVAVTVLGVLGGVVPAGPVHAQQDPARLTATALDPVGRVRGAEVASARLARTDPDLLAPRGPGRVAVLVRLDQDPLATYTGGVDGAPATSPAATGRPLTAEVAATSTHARRAATREAEVTRALRAAVPGLRVVRRLPVLYGGLAATVPADQVAAVLAVPGVVAVQSDAPRPLRTGPDPVPDAPDGDATAGEGTTVAVLGGAVDRGDDRLAGPAAEDRDLVTDPSARGPASRASTELAAAVAATAPAVALGSYRVCAEAATCAPSTVVAGLEAAVLDGADVATHLLPAPADPRTDPVALAALGADAAGTVVVDGSSAAWTATVDGPDDQVVARTGRTAGIVAATAGANPGWSGAQVRSALAAGPVEGLDPAVGAEPGLTFDETLARTLALGAEGTHLNTPAVEAVLDGGRLATTRTVTNVSDGPATYRAEADVPGATVEVRPARFTLGPGARKELAITVEASGSVTGEVRLVADARPPVHLPVRAVGPPADVRVTTLCAAAAVAVTDRAPCTATATNEGGGATTVAGTTVVDEHLRVDAAGAPAAVTGPRSTALAPTTLSGREPGALALEPTGTEGYVPLDSLGVDPVPVGDREGLEVALDRPVTFDGATSDRLGVTSDGYLVVGGIDDATGLVCCPSRTPDEATPDGVVAPFWTDLTGTGAPGISVATVTDGARRWVVVEWRLAVVGTGARRTFQAWLGQDGAHDVGLAYPAGRTPSTEGLAAPVAVGATGRDGRTGALRPGDEVLGGPGPADQRVTAAAPGPPDAVSWPVEVAGWAGGAGVVRTEVTASGATDPAADAAEVAVDGPGPGAVEADVDRLADDLTEGALAPARRADLADRLRTGTLTREGLARVLATDPAWLGRVVDATYQEVAGAAPDADGRRFWVEALASGTSVRALVAALVGTEAFYDAAGRDLGALVDLAFARVLGRAPDADGRDYWVARLDAGLSRAALGHTLAALDEVGARRVRDVARLLLDRDPTPTEAARWEAVLRRGTVVDLTTAVASSPAYREGA